jgi:light-regulated signal transduction histidine kinase (bacteriophytochrome)
MNAQVSAFAQEYLSGLHAYLRDGDESALSTAYELGRRALIEGLGVLDMATLHHVAIADLVLPAEATERARFAVAAAEYFNELMSPFEMSFRGYRVANEELQRLNQTLLLQKEAVESTNRELEAFSYSVSHDLRGPLGGIDGLSHLLLERHAHQLDQEGVRYLRFIHQAIAQMLQLIDGLLILARVTRAEMQRTSVDLTAVAHGICNRLQTLSPDRHVHFVIGDRVRGEGDPRLLAVLLENLLGNAWKFTSKRPDATIEFDCSRLDGRTVYHVRDNGAGFDMQHAAKLFGSFSRLHAASDFEGHGIGLATVQRIVLRHDGEIWANGKVNGGATFYFTLESGRTP